MGPGSVAERGSFFPVLLLAAGVCIGVGLAAWGLVQDETLPADAVAVVNGIPISRGSFERTVEALASDRRDGVDEAERRRVLDRLVEEELVLQRALELDLARRDPRIRAELTQALIRTVVEEAETRVPSEDELRRFFEAHRELFSSPDRFSVRQVFLRVSSSDEEPRARERASEAARRLRAGEPFEEVRRDLGSPETVPLPEAPLPPGKLRDYLGPTATRTVLGLRVGEVGGPVRSSMGYHVVQLLARVPSAPPRFEEVRDHVLALYRRKAGERAFRDYLSWLRERARIRLRAEFR
ncbi:MAG: hypothetical protein KatS3mg076_1197 [Candidatus Binatia bacterium]|nr:MAG: hypothetical protein KatS3mg076_1197 [Candidatus Binatia bacterium]